MTKKQPFSRGDAEGWQAAGVAVSVAGRLRAAAAALGAAPRREEEKEEEEAGGGEFERLVGGGASIADTGNWLSSSLDAAPWPVQHQAAQAKTAKEAKALARPRDLGSATEGAFLPVVPATAAALEPAKELV